jgi:hypothetical protein
VIDHLVLPCAADVDAGSLLPDYRAYLTKYLADLEARIDAELLASSELVAGCVADLWLNGKPSWAWVEIAAELLEHEHDALAYSRRFSEQLYGFGDQWRQADAHSIYARAWVELNTQGEFEPRWRDQMSALIQPSGWIFNPRVSPTTLRHRMRSEQFMQLAMGASLLVGGMSDATRDAITAAAVSFPTTSYVSAEYFRFRTLQLVDRLEQMVVGTPDVLKQVKTIPGFSDFSLASKTDAYMGTAKRTQRDVVIFSPICTLYALELATALEIDLPDEAWTDAAQYLRAKPLDIPAFRMRDLTAPFGDSVTAHEIIAAAILVDEYGEAIAEA